MTKTTKLTVMEAEKRDRNVGQLEAGQQDSSLSSAPMLSALVMNVSKVS